MRRIGQCFEAIIAPAHLWAAWLDFRRGKRTRPTVARFAPNAARHVHRLHRALRAESYRPEGYRVKVIHEPKRRVIAAAVVRDRIVHHALYRCLAPQLDHRLVNSTFACRPGRGTHRAVLAFQRGLRAHRYVLMLDVAAYFASIHAEVLQDVLARLIKDRRVLALMGRIIDTGTRLYARPDVRAALAPVAPAPNCGLPIGNLTSQWWANHYLGGLDHALVRAFGAPYAQRYMDDIAVFADDRVALDETRIRVAEWLRTHRRLRLKDPDAPVRSTRGAFTYLGFRVTRQDLRVTGPGLARAERRLRTLAAGGDHGKAQRSLASYRGWLRFPASSEGGPGTTTK